MGRRTPLYDRHVAAGARMVNFAGYDMPLQYSGIRDEHVGVRERAGIFDVSHMGEVAVNGPGAPDFVQRLVTNDVGRLVPNQLLYSVMCNERWGIVDDVIVMRGNRDNHFIIVVNASTREKDVAWMHEHAGSDVEVTDISDEIALIAVQGPHAADILEPLARMDEGAPGLRELRPFFATGLSLAGVTDAERQRISRTGYTGEDGFEVYSRPDDAEHVWTALAAEGSGAGLVPAGLAARDTLRLEAGMPLYGNELGPDVTPFEAGLGRVVKFDKPGDFVGRQALSARASSGPRQHLAGLTIDSRRIARHGYPVLADGEAIGTVTSGAPSPTLGVPIAMAYLSSPAASLAGAVLTVGIRGEAVPAHLTDLPFYSRRR